MIAHWHREPPVECLVAAYMGYKPKGSHQTVGTADMHVQPRAGMHISEFDEHDRAILRKMSEQASELTTMFGRPGGLTAASLAEVARARERSVPATR